MERKRKQSDFILGGSQITADGDCSHKIEKRHLLFERKAVTNIDSVLKVRDINLLTKFHIMKAVVFSEFMYVCESWTIKRLSAGELMLSNYGTGKDSSPLDCKAIKPVKPKGNQQ